MPVTIPTTLAGLYTMSHAYANAFRAMPSDAYAGEATDEQMVDYELCAESIAEFLENTKIEGTIPSRRDRVAVEVYPALRPLFPEGLRSDDIGQTFDDLIGAIRTARAPLTAEDREALKVNLDNVRGSMPHDLKYPLDHQNVLNGFESALWLVAGGEPIPYGNMRHWMDMYMRQSEDNKRVVPHFESWLTAASTLAELVDSVIDTAEARLLPGADPVPFRPVPLDAPIIHRSTSINPDNLDI